MAPDQTLVTSAQGASIAGRGGLPPPPPRTASASRNSNAATGPASNATPHTYSRWEPTDRQWMPTALVGAAPFAWIR
jgi:hypothetical protein